MRDLKRSAVARRALGGVRRLAGRGAATSVAAGRVATGDATGRLPLAGLPERLGAEERRSLEQEAAALGPWLQGPFPLGGGVELAGPWRCDLRWQSLDVVVPRDLQGARVLDVGCNAGYDAFMFKLRGAAAVLACDPYDSIRQARFLERIYGTGVDFRQLGWQALDPAAHGSFDLVHCGGVLFHEPHQLRMLRRLHEVTAPDGTLLLGAMVLAEPAHELEVRFVDGSHGGDRSWWWVPARGALERMLAAAGFAVKAAFGESEGPAAEFATRYVYLSASRAEPDAALVSATLPESDALTRFPLGHYYSPVPDPRELASEPRRSQIWPERPRRLVGVDWRDAEHRRLVAERFARQERLDFAHDPPDDPTVYFTANDQYPALDAWLLEAMLQELRPRRFIEVGSGFSSLVTARVNRELLGRSMHFTCIEPYPRDFLLAGVDGITELRTEKIQDTPLDAFSALGDGDVLFIDTSHTVKTGGDVPWLFNEVLPRLAEGVVVHVHDVFLPGDYPQPWVLEGWGWNEIYLVQAFLAFNDAFEIVAGAQYLLQNHPDALLQAFPGMSEARHAARGGGALWLRRAVKGSEGA